MQNPPPPVSAPEPPSVSQPQQPLQPAPVLSQNVNNAPMTSTFDAGTGQAENSETMPLPTSSEQAQPQQEQRQNLHQMTTRAKKGISKPNTKYANTAQFQKETHTIPKTIAQALADPRWRQAVLDEFNSIVKNGTYSLVPPTSHQNTVSCRWIFTIKYNPDGTVRKYKARLVARGYTQVPGIDYTETFSPVIKSTTIRLVLDIAISRNWPIKQLDVNNAFLQGTLTEEVYTTQPPGFIDADHPHHVCRLHKALYGLKQAPRAWYQELSNHLLKSGFTNSLADTSLFILRRHNSLIYLLVYVDDIIITGNDPVMLQQTLTLLATRFSVKDPEDLNSFLGIEAHRTNAGMHLTQRRYILDLLQRCNMTDAKPVSTPMATAPKLSASSGTLLSDPTVYRSTVGSLQYLAFTRPDISYAVNRLSQYMHKPTTDHWQAAKRVLRYLAGTTSHGLYFSRNNVSSLHAFSDADWAGDTDDFVSTNAYIIYLGKHPVSWSSKKQKGVARSSSEAEYRSVANTSAEIRWICSLLVEFGIKISSPPVIYCDNVRRNISLC